MTARRVAPPPPRPPDLPPDRAHALLSKQLESLQKLKGRDCDEAAQDRDGWEQVTEILLIRAFGEGDLNGRKFRDAKNAGIHFVRMDMFGSGYHGRDPQDQKNYDLQVESMETALKAALAMLAIDLPEPEIKGTYEPGQEWEFYRDVKTILAASTKEILIFDAYLNADVFDNTYAGAIERNVGFRLVSNNVPPGVLASAKKYVSGGNFQFRESAEFHDRVMFADDRVFLSGQSLKDAAKKKPTYLIEHDEPVMRQIYEGIWNRSKSIL